MSMRADPQTLRQEANRARRIARSFNDPTSIRAMIDYADECETRANELESDLGITACYQVGSELQTA